MFLSVVYAATVALLSLPSFVYPSPLVARAGHGVWNPPITAPGAGDVWAVGSTQLVTWNTDNIPPSAVNRTGTLLLGYLDEGTHGENLDTYRPLADGFPLTDRYVRILVPDVKPRDTYIVVLMGNSGNASPEFRIVKDRSNPAITHEAFDDTISSHNPGGLDSEVDPVDTEPIPNEIHPQAQCKGRPPGSGSGRTSSHAEDTPSDQAPDKPC